MQKYVYRVLFKTPGNEWRVLTPNFGSTKLYTRKQDAKSFIGNSLESDWTGGEVEYKIQKALIGEWQDEAI